MYCIQQKAYNMLYNRKMFGQVDIIAKIVCLHLLTFGRLINETDRNLLFGQKVELIWKQVWIVAIFCCLLILMMVLSVLLCSLIITLSLSSDVFFGSSNILREQFNAISRSRLQTNFQVRIFYLHWNMLIPKRCSTIV